MIDGIFNPKNGIPPWNLSVGSETPRRKMEDDVHQKRKMNDMNSHEWLPTVDFIVEIAFYF